MAGFYNGILIMLKDSGANTPESKLFIGQQIANGYSYQEIRVSHRYRNGTADIAGKRLHLDC